MQFRDRGKIMEENKYEAPAVVIEGDLEVRAGSWSDNPEYDSFD
jgi:hypothetical protein